MSDYRATINTSNVDFRSKEYKDADDFRKNFNKENRTATSTRSFYNHGNIDRSKTSFRGQSQRTQGNVLIYQREFILFSGQRQSSGVSWGGNKIHPQEPYQRWAPCPQGKLFSFNLLILNVTFFRSFSTTSPTK